MPLSLAQLMLGMQVPFLVLEAVLRACNYMALTLEFAFVINVLLYGLCDYFQSALYCVHVEACTYLTRRLECSFVEAAMKTSGFELTCGPRFSCNHTMLRKNEGSFWGNHKNNAIIICNMFLQPRPLQM